MPPLDHPPQIKITLPSDATNEHAADVLAIAMAGKQPGRASSLEPIILNYDDNSDLYVVHVSEWDKYHRPGPRYAPDGDPFGRPCPKSDNQMSGHKGAWQGMCARAHFFAKQPWVAAAFVWRERGDRLWMVTDDGRISRYENLALNEKTN